MVLMTPHVQKEYCRNDESGGFINDAHTTDFVSRFRSIQWVVAFRRRFRLSSASRSTLWTAFWLVWPAMVFQMGEGWVINIGGHWWLPIPLAIIPTVFALSRSQVQSPYRRLQERWMVYGVIAMLAGWLVIDILAKWPRGEPLVNLYEVPPHRHPDLESVPEILPQAWFLIVLGASLVFFVIQDRRTSICHNALTRAFSIGMTFLRSIGISAFLITYALGIVICSSSMVNALGSDGDFRETNANFLIARQDVRLLPDSLLRSLIRERYFHKQTVSGSLIWPANSEFELLERIRSPKDQWSQILFEEGQRRHGPIEKYSRGFRNVRHGPASDHIYEVDPGSPADKAGFVRGDEVLEIDGVPVKEYFRRNDPRRGPSRTYLVRTRTGETVSRTVTAGNYRPQWIGEPRLIGERMGYLRIDEFSNRAHATYADAVNRLKRIPGLEDIVLDLRYNPGGDLSFVAQIARPWLPDTAQGLDLLSAVDRDGHREVFRVKARDDSGSPGVTRIFIITSAATCSASESLVYALRPFMQVVTVGDTTCGKPFAYAPVSYGYLSLALMEFEVRNHFDAGEYVGGIQPTCFARDDYRYDTFDRREASMAEVMYYSRFGTCSQDEPLARFDLEDKRWKASSKIK